MRTKKQLFERIETILDQGYVIGSDPESFNLDDELDDPVILHRVDLFLKGLDSRILEDQ
tara:strand:+ start:623 stop:799 length:177 start_codon:yes stop_codon:yes gene_type:complete